jgi:UDPglucose 6-dehydrogenase
MGGDGRGDVRAAVRIEPAGAESEDHVNSRQRQVAVIGCGHVGLVLAAGLAQLGHRVIGVDRAHDVVVGLSRGITPFHEDGLEELVDTGLASGRLSFTGSYENALENADFVFLAVDTPPTATGAPDLANLRAAAGSVAASLHGARPILVVKSTVPVGTCALLEEVVAELSDSSRVSVVSNPEFLRQGRAVYDFFHPDRTVIGATDEGDAVAVADLFRDLPGARVMVDVPTAEMIKYASNAFLATRLSFINEIATMCEALGVDVDGVVEGMGHDPRIGPLFLRPGIGYGGSCLPKDVAAMRYMADVHGTPALLLAAVDAVNSGLPGRAVQRLAAELGGLDGASVAVWGVTFKGGTDDARRSPAMDVVELLVREGARIHIFDPSGAYGLPDHLRGALRPDPLQAAADTDALAVLADWDEFAAFDLRRVRGVMRGNLILDARNVLDPVRARYAGFRYIGMGRGQVEPAARRALAAHQAFRAAEPQPGQSSAAAVARPTESQLKDRAPEDA